MTWDSVWWLLACVAFWFSGYFYAHRKLAKQLKEIRGFGKRLEWWQK